MHDLCYVFDMHVLDASDVASSHVSKWWTPFAPYVQIVRSGSPIIQSNQEEWILYQSQAAISDLNGYGRRGHQLKLLTCGPQGHGGIHLLRHQADGFTMWNGAMPTLYGFGWALWTGGTLVAGDCVQFNAVYRKVR